MAEQITLAVHPRPGGGKGEARMLRRQGRVPAVAYGSDLQARALSIDARELYHALHTEAGLNAILRLRLDGQTHLALAREVQRHPVRREIMHVDLVTVNRNVKVHVEIPIHLQGEAPGVEEGGVADQSLHMLQIEVLPLEVPSEIVLDVSDMNLGDVKRVEDLQLPAGVEALDDPDRTVVSVTMPDLEVPEEEPTEVTDEQAAIVGAEGETLAEAAAEGAGEPRADDQQE